MDNPDNIPQIVIEALQRAMTAAEEVRGTTSPNPPVGAAILDTAGNLVGVGATQPPGGSHAEIMAIAQAGTNTQGGTAVVTLEPCNHTGRTGPCSHAILDAGITTVYYVHSDPNPVACGGATWLADRGVQVIQLPGHVPALRPWLIATRMQRPHLTWKTSNTIDGFTAALDGTSQWITGEDARHHAHRDRSKRDAIIVGTGTYFADNPQLTARTSEGTLYPHQPRRIVVGRRAVNEPGWEHYPDSDTALTELWRTGARDVLIEGGATLATSLLSRGLIDAVHAYIAPAFLGQGLGVVTEALGTTITDIRRFTLDSVTRLGDDVLLELAR